MDPAERHVVLVTGSSGMIGRVVTADLLAAGHHVRGFDKVAHPDLDDQIVADVTDRAAVCRATAGVDRVIHLAAYPNAAPFVEVLVPANVVGLYHVALAAVEAGVRRLVLASSVQVVGMPGQLPEGPLPVTFADPRNDYALTKLWAEHLGRMVARRYGLEVIAARIGWFVRNATEAAIIAQNPEGQLVYLARSDAARFFRCAVEAPKIDTEDGSATLYAVGPGLPSRPSPFDLKPARRLIGYEPRVSWPDEAPQRG